MVFDMTDIVDFWLWAPDKVTYMAVVPDILLPDGTPLASLPDEETRPAEANSLVYAKGVACSEIAAIVKTPAVYGEDGETIVTPAVLVPGYHANFRVWGALARFLTFGQPTEGTLFERTRLIELLDAQLEDDMTAQAKRSDGVKAGYEGPNGIRVTDRPTDLARAFG